MFCCHYYTSVQMLPLCHSSAGTAPHLALPSLTWFRQIPLPTTNSTHVDAFLCQAQSHPPHEFCISTLAAPTPTLTKAPSSPCVALIPHPEIFPPLPSGCSPQSAWAPRPSGTRFPFRSSADQMPFSLPRLTGFGLNCEEGGTASNVIL